MFNKFFKFLASKYKETVQYTFFVGTLTIGFSYFVACGAQMYKVSLEGDTSPPKSARVNQGENGDELLGIHAVHGWNILPVNVSVGQKFSSIQQKQVLAAMRLWEWAVGKQIFVYQGLDSSKDGDNYIDLYSSLDDRKNTFLMDLNWAKTKKKKEVLATTIWDTDTNDSRAIATADIRYNNEYYVFGNALVERSQGSRVIVDMFSLALHEIGHFLGLSHVNTVSDKDSVMNPSLFIGEGLTTRILSRGDIERIQTIYGCSGNACDINYLLDSQKDFQKKLEDEYQAGPGSGSSTSLSKISLN